MDPVQSAIVSMSKAIVHLDSRLAPEPPGRLKVFFNGTSQFAPGAVLSPIQVSFKLNTIIATIVAGGLWVWEGAISVPTGGPFPPPDYYFPPQGTYTVPVYTFESGVMTLAFDPGVTANAVGCLHLQGW